MPIALDILDQETQEIHAHAKRSSTRVVFMMFIQSSKLMRGHLLLSNVGKKMLLLQLEILLAMSINDSMKLII